MTGLSPVVLLYSAGAIYKPVRHKEPLYFLGFQMFNEEYFKPKRKKRFESHLVNTLQRHDCLLESRLQYLLRKKKKKKHNWNIPEWIKIYFFSILNTQGKMLNKIRSAMRHDCRT
jgi:cytidylate kinase